MESAPIGGTLHILSGVWGIAREQIAKHRKRLLGLALLDGSGGLRLLEYALEKEDALEEGLQLLWVNRGLPHHSLAVLIDQIAHHVDTPALQLLSSDYST